MLEIIDKSNWRFFGNKQHRLLLSPPLLHWSSRPWRSPSAIGRRLRTSSTLEISRLMMSSRLLRSCGQDQWPRSSPGPWRRYLALAFLLGVLLMGRTLRICSRRLLMVMWRSLRTDWGRLSRFVLLCFFFPQNLKLSILGLCLRVFSVWALMITR